MIRGVVAIIGRPNVGKSTLFNALTRSRRALVDDRPGVTRDRIYGKVEHSERIDEGFWLIDTGGFETDDVKYQPFKDNIVWNQAEVAIESADLIIFLADSQTGLHAHDEVLFRYLQKTGKPLICVANKVDNEKIRMQVSEFFSLGVEEIMEISAAHQRGVAELREKISLELDAIKAFSEKTNERSDVIPLALIGRPNVGKSSILNRLLGEERSLVSEVAGTTRDNVDQTFNYNKKPYLIIDTAGIRRKARVKDRLESLSVIQSLHAIDRSEVVALVLDAVEGIGDQDARLASLAIDQRKALLIVVNKWDLVPNKTANLAKEYAEAIRAKIKTMAYVPVIFVSCKENQRIFRILEEVEMLHQHFSKRVSTSELNRSIEQILLEHTPALSKRHNKRLKFYYATQVLTKPPTIVIKCNLPDEIQESYKRYLTNRIRDDLGFTGVPIRLIFRDKKRSEKLQA